MRYELAVFDMDGTILNTLEDLTDSTNATMRACGYPEHTLDEVRFFVGNGIRKLIERALPEGVSDEEREHAFQEFMAYYKVHSADKTKPYPGILELLQHLQSAGVKTAVVSNKADPAVKVLAQEYFPGLFDQALGENEAAGIAKKPAPDMVNLVLEELGMTREQACYIGDSDVDYQTAVNSGLDPILVDWGFRDRDFLQRLGADCICSDPLAVEKIILAEELNGY